MNKFIEALKEAGIYDRIVKTIVNVRKRNDVKDTTKGITTILKIEMNRNPKLFNIYVNDIEELAFKTVITEIMKSVADVEKNDAMEDVNLEEMLKESTEKKKRLKMMSLTVSLIFLMELQIFSMIKKG